MNKYEHFIPQNKATVGARRIAIFDEKGNRVGQIPLGILTPPEYTNRKYTFGAISDVHVVYDTAEDDLKRAMTFFSNNEDVSFVCISGDLTDAGTEAQLQKYKNVIDNYAKIPVYAVAGNHEYYTSTSNSYLENYTGYPLYYMFEHEKDVFIMVGVVSGTEGGFFLDGELQWLYEQLEANRNRRCFLFEHILPVEGCGDGLNIYPHGKLKSATESVVFKSLIAHYHNIVFFHGHSHMMFDIQEHSNAVNANYDHYFGCHSVHIPSLAVPRDINEAGTGYMTYYAGSEGYVVDVYDDGIHLRGRDFVNEKYLPVATYWLDTDLVNIEAGTYFDSTGTIDTGTTSTAEQISLTWNENYSVSSTGELQSQTSYVTSDIINLESGYTYTVYGTDLSGMSIYPQWYDANGYVGTGKIADGHGWNTSTTGSAKYVVSPPDGVTRMRLQGYCATTSNMAKKVTMYRVRS